MPVSLLRAGQRIGHYVLEERIGFGGMGEVWRGRHEMLARQVAIKSIVSHLAADPEFASRFRLEAKAQAALIHPRIVAVTDFFFVPEGFFLVMPLISGDSLDHRLDPHQPLPLAEAFAIGMDTLDALDHAHGKGVIHRDVKPANILVDRQGHACLTDFGIALMIGQQRLTQTGTTIGTPHYMSPEQILRPRALDHRTDIYSVGCVLYEMLAGRPPFDVPGDSAEVDFLVKEAHLRQPPPPPRAINPAIPAAVEQVILKALAKKPEERFATCAELAAALTSATWEPAGVAATRPMEVRTTRRAPTDSPAVDVNAVTPAPMTVSKLPPLPAAPPDPPIRSSPAIPTPPPLPPSATAPRTLGPTLAVSLLLLAPLLVTLGILAGRFASPSEVTVAPEGAAFSTIGAAIKKVRRGGRVVVGPGIYRESVLVTGELELLAGGARDEVVIEASQGPSMVLDSAGVSVRGLTLRLPAGASGGSTTVVQIRSGNPLIEDCSILGRAASAVKVAGGASPVLRRCRLQPVGGNGIVFDGGARGRLESCEISDALCAVVVSQGAELAILGCKLLTSSQNGLQVEAKGSATLEDCEITTSGQTGVDVTGPGRVVIRRAVIQGGHGAGMVLRDLGDALLEACQLTGNAGNGLEVSNAGAILRDCTIRDSGGRGVWARDNATVTLERCTLATNARGAQLADRSSRILKQ